MSCSVSYAKRSFYRSSNAVFVSDIAIFVLKRDVKPYSIQFTPADILLAQRYCSSSCLLFVSQHYLVLLRQRAGIIFVVPSCSVAHQYFTAPMLCIDNLALFTEDVRSVAHKSKNK